MTEQPNNPFAGYSGTRNGEAYDPQAGRPRFPSDNPVTTPFPQMPRDQQINSLRQWDAQTPPGYQRIWWRRDPKNENLIYWKPDAQYRYRPDMPPAIWDSKRQFQGYWDDPKNVVKAYNYLRVQDDDFVPPSFMDKDFVNSMYKTLAAYNGTQYTALWKPLPYGSEESYYAYTAPGPDLWESNPNNRHLYPDNPQRVNLGGRVALSTGVTASIENVQAIIDDVNAELLVKLANDEITQEDYEQSIRYFSQYALSDEGRAYVGQNLTEEQLAAPFDPRDYSGLAVTGLLEQQGVLDLNGKPFKEYSEMEPFSKVLLTLFGAPENLNTPEYSKQVSATIQGGMAGFGAWGAVMTYGMIAAKVSAGPSAALFATGVGAPVAAMIPIVAFALAGVVGYLQYASAVTGKENFISKGFSKLMNFFAEGTERAVGTATIMSEIKSEADKVRNTGATEEEVSKAMLDKYGVSSQDFWENFGRAWTASRMYYESSGGKGAGDWLVDTVSTAAHSLNPEWSSGLRTAPGEVWQLQLGKDSPSALGLNSVETRAAIMRDLYALGPNPDRQSKEGVFAMWQDALGMSGNMNDFVGQMFIDPLNFAPGAVNKGLDIHAQKQFKLAVAADDLPTARWYASLSEAAKHAPGNPIIDSLPFGVQNFVEEIFRVASRTPKGVDAPKWLRGTINPVSSWHAAAGMMGSGYQPKMIIDLMNDMRAKGYSAPVGSTLNVSGGTPGMTPTVKVFVSSDKMHAQFSLVGTDGSIIGRQFISSDGNLPFVDVDDILKQFKEMVGTDNYKSQFPNDGFANALLGDLKVEHSSTITYSDYIKSYAADLAKAGEEGATPTGSSVYDDMLKSIGKPVIVDAKTGLVVNDGVLVADSIKDGSAEYQVTSADGKTLYTVQASNDEVIGVKVDGKDVAIVAGDYIVAPYKVAELSDPAVSRINIHAVNDLAEALGVTKPYPSDIDLVGSKPAAGAEPTKLTGNKLNDYFLKLNDYTPESKIAITNRAIVQTILGALLVAKNDPDKFFAFFDYLAGKKVDVSPAMKNWAAGKVVATAMLTLKSALKDGSAFAMLRTAWETSTVRRVEVTNFARILEITPEKLVTMKPDDILKKLNAYNTRIAKIDPTKVLNMTAAEIKKFLSPYTGADALPLTKKALVDKASFAFISDSEKAAIQMFDPQVKSGLTQFSSMLKSIIGLPLISANPATWMMNAFNNWITMNIMVGTGGLTITNKSMRDSIARMGVDYTLLVGNQFKVGENEILASKELQEILNPDNWMTGVKRFMSNLSSSDKTPLDDLARAAGTKPEQLIEMGAADIVKAVKKSRSKKFAHLSEAQISRMIAPYVGDNAKPLTKNTHNPLATYGKIEQFFAIRTMKLAVDRMMGRTPLSDIPAADRAALKSLGMTDRQIDAFQKSSNRAYNMDEILSFFKDGEIKYNPVPVEIIDAALDKLSGGDPAQRAAIDDLLDFNGLRDDITDMLSKPRSPEEMDAIQNSLFDKLTDVADQTRANNLAAEFAKVTEDTSGHIGLLKNLYMIAQQEYQTLYNANRQFGTYWDSIDQAAKTMPTDQLRAYKASMWEITSRAVKKMWDSTYKVMLNGITAGMQKVGLGEDGDFFVNNLAERLTLMRTVYEKITKINDDAHDGVIKNTDVGKLLDQIYAEYRKARDVNQKAWVDKIVELYDKSGVPLSGMTKEQMHARMVGFMGEFLKRDRTFRNKVLDHRRTIESMDYGTKRAANKTFYEGTYQAESLDMLKFLTNEAYENFNTQRNPKHTSKGAGQTGATKPKAKTPGEAAVENKRSLFNRNETALEHSRMMNDQAKAAYGQYNKQLFLNELNASTNLTEPQRFAAAAYFDAFDATVRRLTNNEFGFYDRVGSIDAFEGDYLPQDRFVSPSGERYIAAMTYGPDGKFILNFATESADAVSVWHEGSRAIVDTARRLYEMGVFEGYKTIIEDVGKTTIEAFDAMDTAAKGAVYDAIADNMFKWQSDIEVAKSMPTGLKAAFTTMATFFADLIKSLFKRYKDVEVSPAVKEVYRSLFVHNDVSAKADRNATRIRQYRDGTPFKVYGAKKGSSYDLIPVVVDASLIQPSHDLGGFKNQDFPENYQPREYSLSFVSKQAPVLNPDLLLNRPVDMSSGSPVIDQHGNVIAGNHRVGILMLAKEDYPDSWRKYQDALPGSLERYGLTPADLDGIENPVLVYRIADESYAQSFVDQANVGNQQVMSPTEQAKRFGKALPLDLLTGMKFGENVSFADVVRSPELAELRKAFIDSLYDAEQEQFLISENGYATNILTAAGEQALGQAILARAYGGTPEGENLIKAIIGDDKGVFTKNLTEALVQTAPAAIKIDSLIAAGKLDPSYSITARLSNAVTEYTIWTRRPAIEKDMSIADHGNTLMRQTPEIIIKMEEFFNNNLRSSKRLANLFNLYAEEAVKTVQQPSAEAESMLIPGLTFEAEKTVEVRDADTILNEMLDKANAASQYEVKIDAANENVNVILNNTIDNWGEVLKKWFEPLLTRMKKDISKSPAPTVPPDWANVEGLYSGDTYKPLITTLDEILKGTAPDKFSHPGMRELILQQAHNQLLAEDVKYRMHNGMMDSPEADFIRANKAANALNKAASVGGTDVQKYEALATPLKEAIDLLDELKARNGHAQSIAALEAAIAAAPVKPLSDGDIADAPTQGAFFQPSDLGYRSGKSVFEHYEVRLFDDDMNRSKTITATSEEAAKNMLEREFNSTWRTYAILKVTDDYSKPGNPGHRFEVIDEMRTPDPNRPYRKPPSPPEYYPSGDPSRDIFFQPDELTYQSGDQPLPPVTADPPQGPQSINQSSAIDQLANNDIMNLVGEITDGLQGYMRDNATFDMEKGIPEQALPILQKLAAGWENELDVKKLTAIEYAKLTRDHTLLDYTARRGIDQLIQHVFPYHFWYTSSVTEWAKHMIGDPTVGAAYSQYQELRRKNGMLGFPSRQAGKMWMPAAWLPDYLGDELFSAPFARLMPLESIIQPVSLFTDLSTDMTASTVRIINQWVREKLVTQDQAAAAIQNGSGTIWNDAMAQAVQEDEGTLSDTMTLASQLMGVAPWWQYSYYFATGQKDKISVLPTTKLGQALSSFRSSDMEGGGGTWAGDMVSVIGDVLKAPEEKVRDMLDMSAYGEPGDYYVRLMLTSMLGDGTVTDVAEVEKQMIERKGDWWEEAKRRADVYLSARLPGSLFLHTVNEFAQNPTPQNASGIPQAFFLTMFPAGMIPEGEQKLRDIAPLYQQAWKEYNMGNKNALNEFEDKYPEYRARRNMFKDNDTMLKGFLVDQIWEKWTSIPAASRQLATSSLGNTFETAFLGAKSYDSISNETLAAWSLRLGGLVPDTKQTNVSNLDSAPVPRYNTQVEGAVTAFQDERAELFPNFYWQQKIYWATEEDKRNALKRTMPEYFQYLDWRKKYYESNPLVKAWADDVSSRSTGVDDDLLMDGQSDQANQAIATGSVLFEFDDVLKAELGTYIINGTPLSNGALAELNRLWVAKGKPGNSLQQWLDAVLGLRRQ